MADRRLADRRRDLLPPLTNLPVHGSGCEGAVTSQAKQPTCYFVSALAVAQLAFQHAGDGSGDSPLQRLMNVATDGEELSKCLRNPTVQSVVTPELFEVYDTLCQADQTYDTYDPDGSFLKQGLMWSFSDIDGRYLYGVTSQQFMAEAIQRLTDKHKAEEKKDEDIPSYTLETTPALIDGGREDLMLLAMLVTLELPFVFYYSGIPSPEKEDTADQFLPSKDLLLVQYFDPISLSGKISINDPKGPFFDLKRFLDVKRSNTHEGIRDRTRHKNLTMLGVLASYESPVQKGVGHAIAIFPCKDDYKVCDGNSTDCFPDLNKWQKAHNTSTAKIDRMAIVWIRPGRS